VKGLSMFISQGGIRPQLSEVYVYKTLMLLAWRSLCWPRCVAGRTSAAGAQAARGGWARCRRPAPAACRRRRGAGRRGLPWPRAPPPPPPARPMSQGDPPPPPRCPRGCGRGGVDIPVGEGEERFRSWCGGTGRQRPQQTQI
jgi:hypothetical protein